MNMTAWLETFVRGWMPDPEPREGDACVIRAGKRAFCKVCSLLAGCPVLAHESASAAAAHRTETAAVGPVTRVLRRLRPADSVPSFTPFLPGPALGVQGAPRTASPPHPEPDPAGPA